MRQALTPLIVNVFNVPIMITHYMEKDFGFYISEKNLITPFGYNEFMAQQYTSLWLMIMSYSMIKTIELNVI